MADRNDAAVLPPADENNDVHDRNEIESSSHTSRPSSRSTNNNHNTMLISPNLVAALEYDEKARASIELPSSPGPSRPFFLAQEAVVPGVGLPPPPRPKSSSGSVRKARSPPMSPTTVLIGLMDKDAASAALPPKTSPYPNSKHAATASQSNPYINPPPRLTHLMTDSGLFRTHSRAPSLPDRLASKSPESVRTLESPKSDTHCSPVLVSSPESAGPGPGTSLSSVEGRSSFQRHMRVFSALPRMDKMLVRGRSRATLGPKVGGDKSGGSGEQRRASDVELVGNEGEGRAGKERPVTMRQFFFKSLERHRTTGSVEDGSRSAPVSPVAVSQSVRHKNQVSSGMLLETENEFREVERKRRAGMMEALVSEARQSRSSLRSSLDAGFSLPQPPRHAFSSATTTSPASASQVSFSLAASSESSHDPPPTPDDPRISISSTLYQASNSSIHYSPLYNTNIPLYPHDSNGRPTTTTNTMHSDSESFMDLASPTFSPRSPEFSTNASYVAYTQGQISYPKDTRNAGGDVPLHAPKPSLPAIKTSAVAKPPLPTSPKPNFAKRSRSVQPPMSKSAAPGGSPVAQEAAYSNLPPTTNFLDPLERAGRVRTARKLAQLLGQTPPAPELATMSQQSFEANPPGGFLSASNNLMSNITGKKKHQRGAVSVSVTPSEHDSSSRVAPEHTKHASLTNRRHSSPLSPESFSFVDAGQPWSSDIDSSRHSSVMIEIGSQQGEPCSDWTSHTGHARGALTSPTSFMDFSEEDGASSLITRGTPKLNRPHLLSSGASVYSFTSEELAEEERRRKREKLAKLHRFLGSRVPLEVVLNQLDLDTALDLDLPPVAPVSAVDRLPSSKMDTEPRKVWLRRRRSSSAAELGGKWSEDIDRLKEELNDKEKAQNVRRAIKMEKMFGVQPPQTLYHTRSAPSHAEAQLTATTKQPNAPSSPLTPTGRNINRSAYKSSKGKKSSNRPGTADSSKPLLEPSNSNIPGFSEVYEHYRHSLNSLNDIMDRDDRVSLERLHSIIHGDTDEPTLQPFALQDDAPPTPKAERRRSLPSRASMTSISSEFSMISVATPTVEETAFQARRKRAAKLTQFFGVNYRDLMNEVLDSLEKGLEEERGRGTLRPDEAQELLQKLRKLKIKRNSSLTFTNP